MSLSRMTLPNGETRRPAQGFRCIATTNQDPRVIEPALLDRFPVRLEVSEPGPGALATLDTDEDRAFVRAGYSNANDISEDGSTIIGRAEIEDGFEAFRWTDSDGMVGLGALPGGDSHSSPHDMSTDGSIIIGTSATDLGNEVFRWTEANGMRRLSDILTLDYNLDLTGWTLQWASGISVDGTTIVGGGINPNGDFEAFIARIPTPGALMLFGLGGLAILRRRR